MQMHASDANNNYNNNIKSNHNSNHRPVRQGRATGQRGKNKFSFFSLGRRAPWRTLTKKSLLALRVDLWYPMGNILCVCEEKYHEKEEFPLP